MSDSINKLGETSLDDWFEAVPGTMMVMESLPYGLATLGGLMISLAPGSIERVNSNVLKMSMDGNKIIEEAGGPEAYDAMVRAKRVKGPKADLVRNPQISFD
jgi:hypothetical protein